MSPAQYSPLLMIDLLASARAVAFSPADAHLVLACAGRIALLTDLTGRERLRVTPRVFGRARLLDCAFTPDGARFATAGSDGAARIRNSTTGAQLLRVAHNGPVEAVAFSPDGTFLATAGSDGTARIRHSVSGEHVIGVTHGMGGMHGVAFSPDGTLLATASADHTARLWAITTGTELRTFPHDGSVQAVAFSPDGTLLATVGEDPAVWLWPLTPAEPQMRTTSCT